MYICFTFLLSYFYAYISALHMHVLHYCVRFQVHDVVIYPVNNVGMESVTIN